MLAEVAKFTVHERRRRLRHEHLSPMAGRRDTRSAMDVDAHVALIGHERRPRVQTDPHANRARRERLGQLGGGGESGGRSRECEEERVALRVDLNPTVAGASFPYGATVPCERLGIRLCPKLVQEFVEPSTSVKRKVTVPVGRSCAHSRDHPPLRVLRPLQSARLRRDDPALGRRRNRFGFRTQAGVAGVRGC